MFLKGFKINKKLSLKFVKTLSIFMCLTLVMCLGYLTYENLYKTEEVEKVAAAASFIYTSSEGIKYTTADLLTDRFGNPARYDISSAGDGSLYANVIRFHKAKSTDSLSYTKYYPNAYSKFGVVVPKEEYMLVFTGEGTNTVWFDTLKVNGKYYSGYTTSINETTVTNPNESNFRNITYGGGTGVTVPWLHSLTDEQISKITTGIISSETGNIRAQYFFAGLPNLQDVRFDISGTTKKKLKELNGMFMSSGLKTVDFSNIDTTTISSTFAMFYDCYNLEEFDCSYLSDMNFVDDFQCSFMFGECPKIKKLDFSSWREIPCEIQGFIDGCTSLEYLNLHPFYIYYYAHIFNLAGCTNLKAIGLPVSYDKEALYWDDLTINLPSGTWGIYTEDGTKISIEDRITKEEVTNPTDLVQYNQYSYSGGENASYLLKESTKTINVNNLKLGDIVELGKPNDSNLNEKYKWRVVAFSDLDGDSSTGTDGKEAPLLMLDDWYCQDVSGVKTVQKTNFDSRAENAYDPSDFANTHLDGRSDTNGPFDEGDYTPNRYATSDIRKFLNSDSSSGLLNYDDGYTLSGTNVIGTKGFLANFGSDINYLRTVPIKTLSGYAQIKQEMYNGGTKTWNAFYDQQKNVVERNWYTIWEGEESLAYNVSGIFRNKYATSSAPSSIYNDDYLTLDDGYYETTYDRVFLPSLKEMAEIYMNSSNYIRDILGGDTNPSNGYRWIKYKNSAIKNSASTTTWNQKNVRSFWLRDAGSMTTVGTFVYNMDQNKYKTTHDTTYLYRFSEGPYYSVKMKEVRESKEDGYEKIKKAKIDTSYVETSNSYEENYEIYSDTTTTNAVDRLLTGIVPCCYLKEGTELLYNGLEGDYVISGGTLTAEPEFAKPVTLENNWEGITNTNQFKPCVYVENDHGATITQIGYQISEKSDFSTVLCEHKNSTITNPTISQKANFDTNDDADVRSKLLPYKKYYVRSLVRSTVDTETRTFYGVPYAITTGVPVIVTRSGTEGFSSSSNSLTIKYRVLSLMGTVPEVTRLQISRIGNGTNTSSYGKYYHAGASNDIIGISQLASHNDSSLYIDRNEYAASGYIKDASRIINSSALIESTKDNPILLEETVYGFLFPKYGYMPWVITTFRDGANNIQVAAHNYGASLSINYSSSYPTNNSYYSLAEAYAHYYNYAAKAATSYKAEYLEVNNPQITSLYNFTSTSITFAPSQSIQYAFVKQMGNGGGTTSSNMLLPSYNTSNSNANGQFGVDNSSYEWHEYEKVGTIGDAVPSTVTKPEKYKKYVLKAVAREGKYSTATSYGYYFGSIPKNWFVPAGYNYGQVIRNEAFEPEDGNTENNGEEIPFEMYFPRLGPVYSETVGSKTYDYYPTNEDIIVKDENGKLLRWDISKNQDGSVMAVVFKRIKSQTSEFKPSYFWYSGTKWRGTTYDNEYILAIYGNTLNNLEDNGEKIELTHYISNGNVLPLDGSSTTLSGITKDQIISSENGWMYDDGAKSGNVVPWTLYCDTSKIKKAILVDVYSQDLSGLFTGLSSASELIIDPFGGSVVRDVTNANGLFKDCSLVDELNLSTFDFSNVTSNKGKHMFDNCNKLNMISLPVGVPDFDIDLALSTYCVYKSNMSVNKNFTSIGKLLARTSDGEVAYLGMPIDDAYVLKRVNEAGSDADVFKKVVNDDGISGYLKDEYNVDLSTLNDFMKSLTSNLLYTEKVKHNYTDINVLLNDIKACIAFDLAVYVNNQTGNATVIKNTSAKFKIGNDEADSRILNLLSVQYCKVSNAERMYYLEDYDLNSFSELTGSAWDDDDYYIVASDIEEGSLDAYIFVETSFSNDTKIIQSGNTPHSEDEYNVLKLYYVCSSDPYYARFYDFETDEEYDLTDDKITSKDQINNLMILTPYDPDYLSKGNQLRFYNCPDYVQDYDYSSSDISGDGRAYLKLPKKVITSSVISISGWNTSTKTITATDSNKGIYSAKLTIKNTSMSDDKYKTMSTSDTDVDVITLVLEDSDFTFGDNFSFIYDGNAHYITETINPAKSKAVYTATYHKGSATGDVINKEDIKDVGDYYLVIDVESNKVSAGSVLKWTKKFSIVPRTMSALTLDDSSVLTAEYTGSDIDPKSGFVLKEGDDAMDPSNYIITYKDEDGNTVSYPKEVGEYTVIVEDVTGNYEGTKEFTFTVTKKTVTISDDMYDSNSNLKLEKVYDGLDLYTFDTTINISGTDVPVTVTVKFDSKNVGDSKTVTITQVFKNSADNDLYTFSKDSITKTGKITARAVTYNVSVTGKTYDGTVNIDPLRIIATDIENVVDGDSFGISVIGSYASKDAGEGITVNYTASKTGDDADNYQIVTSGNATADIAQAEIMYSVSVSNKVFDDSPDASSVTTVTYVSGRVNDEDVDVELDGATFDDKAYGNRTVTVTVKLKGNSNVTKNYFVTQPASTFDANITKNVATLSFSFDKSKVYDKTVDATGCVKLDSVTVNGASSDIEVEFTAVFDDANAGSNKKITVYPTFKNADTDGENYQFDKTSYTVTGEEVEITKREISYTSKATNRTYNGSKSVVVTAESLTNVIDGDSPELTLKGEMATKDYGDNKTVNVSVLSVSDSNYKASGTTTTVNISKKDLQILTDAEDKEYDTNDSVKITFSLNSSQIITDDDVDLTKTTGTGTVSNSSHASGLEVTISSWPSLKGDDAKNYNPVHVDCLVNITQWDLTSEPLELNIKSTYDFDNGNPITLETSIKVKKTSEILSEGSDYTITYLDGNSTIGKHHAKIEFRGNYKGSINNIEFTIYGHLKKVKLKEGYKEVVYKGDTVFFDKDFNDCEIKISSDGGNTWNLAPSDSITITSDITIYSIQSKEFYHDSENAIFNFHVYTINDLIEDLKDEINDADGNSKKKQDISKIIEDDRNVDLLFDKDDSSPNGEGHYNEKLKDDDYANFVSEYLAENHIDSSDIEDAKEKIKDLIKEAIDAKELEDNYELLNAEEAMLQYERLNEKLKNIFDPIKLDGLKIKYYTYLGSDHLTRDESDSTNKVEIFGVTNHLDDSSEGSKLVVDRLSDIDKINILQSELNNTQPGEVIIAPYHIEVVKPNDDTAKLNPASGESILVKITLPSNYYDKDLNIYQVDDLGNITKLDIVVQKVKNETFVYFDVSSFGDFILTSNESLSLNVSVNVKLLGDRSLGSVTPQGLKSLSKGSNLALSISSNNKQVTNKATIKTYSFDAATSLFVLNDSKSGIINLNKQSSYNISNINENIYVTVELDFDESFKEEPKPSGGGGGGGGGAVVTPGKTIVVETLPLDKKGEVITFHKAYMNGYEDMTFRPQTYVTREEVATIVARLHQEFNTDYNYTTFNSFDDSLGRWSKNYIGFCKYKDLIKGYEDGSYHPKDNMTRAELATLVSNFMRVQNVEFSEEQLQKAAFSDVDGRWYEEAVNKLASLGILNGYEDGTFKGDNYVTRVEVTIVMNKINGRAVTSDIPSEYITKVTSAFKDVTSNRWFFKDVAESAVDHPDNLY